MEDQKYLVNDDQLQIDESPQYPGPQYLGLQYLGSTNTVITAQPVPHVPQIFRGSAALKTSIKYKAISSLVFSIVSSLFIWPLFCTIPAIVFAILALTEIDTNIYKSMAHAKLAAILSRLVSGSCAILTIIAGIYNYGYIYDYLNENKGVM